MKTPQERHRQWVEKFGASMPNDPRNSLAYWLEIRFDADAPEIIGFGMGVRLDSANAKPGELHDRFAAEMAAMWRGTPDAGPGAGAAPPPAQDFGEARERFERRMRDGWREPSPDMPRSGR